MFVTEPQKIRWMLRRHAHIAMGGVPTNASIVRVLDFNLDTWTGTEPRFSFQLTLILQVHADIAGTT